jgi:hypothetical protein
MKPEAREKFLRSLIMGSEVVYIGKVPHHGGWSWVKIKDLDDGMVCAHGSLECLFQYDELTCSGIRKAQEVLAVMRGDQVVMDGFDDYDDD